MLASLLVWLLTSSFIPSRSGMFSCGAIDILEGTTGSLYASNRWSSVLSHRDSDGSREADDVVIPVDQRKPTEPKLAHLFDSDATPPHGETWVINPRRKGNWKATEAHTIGGYDRENVESKAIEPVESGYKHQLCRYSQMLLFRTLHEGLPYFHLYMSKTGKPDLLISGRFSCGLMESRAVIGQCELPKTPCITRLGRLVETRPGVYQSPMDALPLDLIPLATCHHLHKGPPLSSHDLVCARMETHGNRNETLIYWCIMRGEAEGRNCLWLNTKAHSWLGNNRHYWRLRGSS